MDYRKTEENWNRLKSELKIGDTVQGRIFKVEPYGVYVDIGRDFYGIVLAPQIGKESIAFDEYPKIGETISAIILGFSHYRSQLEFSYVSLSIKAYKEKANSEF